MQSNRNLIWAGIYIIVIAAGAAWFFWGPSSAGKDAEREYEMVKAAHGTPAELCAAATKIADAYLKDHDQPKYEMAKLQQNLDCLTAQNERQSLSY